VKGINVYTADNKEDCCITWKTILGERRASCPPKGSPIRGSRREAMA
jgi:hypothetical protein